MRFPTLRGLIRRRLLVNYRVDVEGMARFSVEDDGSHVARSARDLEHSWHVEPDLVTSPTSSQAEVG